MRANAEKLVADFDIRTSGIEAPVDTLSGGNQQKVIIARETGAEDPLVILSQPTRGLDVGSIQYIHAPGRGPRDAGAAVLLVSSELDEVAGPGRPGRGHVPGPHRRGAGGSSISHERTSACSWPARRCRRGVG